MEKIKELLAGPFGSILLTGVGFLLNGTLVDNNSGSVWHWKFRNGLSPLDGWFRVVGLCAVGVVLIWWKWHYEKRAKATMNDYSSAQQEIQTLKVTLSGEKEQLLGDAKKCVQKSVAEKVDREMPCGGLTGRTKANWRVALVNNQALNPRWYWDEEMTLGKTKIKPKCALVVLSASGLRCVAYSDAQRFSPADVETLKKILKDRPLECWVDVIAKLDPIATSSNGVLDLSL